MIAPNSLHLISGFPFNLLVPGVKIINQFVKSSAFCGGSSSISRSVVSLG